MPGSSSARAGPTSWRPSSLLASRSTWAAPARRSCSSPRRSASSPPPRSWAAPPRSWPRGPVPRIGGLLNVTFGNAPELIIALFALGQGLHELVKATLIGSIVGNILLVLGASMLVGGLEKRSPDASAPTIANVQSTMLLAGRRRIRRARGGPARGWRRAADRRSRAHRVRLDRRAALRPDRRRLDRHLPDRVVPLAQDHRRPRPRTLLRRGGDVGLVGSPLGRDAGRRGRLRSA